MNSDIVLGKLKLWKSQMWLLWAEWFDSDCAWVAGSNHYLSGMLQEDYGRSKQLEATANPDKLH